MPIAKRVILFSALGDQSGCALRASYLSAALQRQGWQCELVLPLFRNTPYSLEAFFSVPYFLLKALFSNASLAVGIKPYPNCWMALWLMRLKGAVVVLDVDDMDGAWRSGWAAEIARWTQAPAFRLLNVFSTHHESIRKWLKGRGKIVKLAQGVDLELFHPSKAKLEKTLFFTAHLNVACQLELLMTCVSPWLKKHQDWTLVVGGGGPMLSQFQRRHGAAQVIFTGALKPAQVALHMNRSRICLSVYDGGRANQFRVPMKCGEYLAAARPVVSNVIQGMSHIKKYIYSCEADAHSFGVQLDRLSAGHGDGREKKGSAWIRKNLSWDKVASDFLGELT